MEKRQRRSIFSCFHTLRVHAVGRRHIMENPFDTAPVKETSRHRGAEHHRGPRELTVFLFTFAQLNIFKLAGSQNNTQNNGYKHNPYIYKAKIGRNKAVDTVDDPFTPIRTDKQAGANNHDKRKHNPNHCFIDIFFTLTFHKLPLSFIRWGAKRTPPPFLMSSYYRFILLPPAHRP